MSKNKSLCDWHKTEIEKHFSELVEIISQPRYLCKKCARAAKKKQFLCKPEKLGKNS